jgi:quercetin dioxygenase-like cupin family protein
MITLFPRRRTLGPLLFCLFLLPPVALAADYNPGVTAKVLQKTGVTNGGQKISYPCTDRAEVTAMTVELAPGAETGWHMHTMPVYAYVVSGTLAVELEGGKSFSFKAGDVIIEVVDTRHNGRNLGTEPVKLTVFYLGAEGLPNVIKAGGPAKTGQHD